MGSRSAALAVGADVEAGDAPCAVQREDVMQLRIGEHGARQVLDDLVHGHIEAGEEPEPGRTRPTARATLSLM